MNDIEYMKIALELAKKGCGYVNPNPMVGAVIVKNDRIIGSGYHERYGQLHAERNSFLTCTESPEGATLYVTLEPCCHYGKTPPCTDAIIENKINTVVVASMDPNPLVSGKGIDTLKNSGIIVRTGVLKGECDRLNEVFFHYIKTQTPYVVMKYAMTMDGKIATCSGKSKWITGETAREHVHQLRHRYSSIMVGVDTVMIDNPLLTCRIPGGKNPTRIVCDTNLRIPLTSVIVSTADQVPTIIATSSEDTKSINKLMDAGCKVIQIPKMDGHIDLRELMNRLGSEKIDSILLEGGATMNFSALSSGIVNKVQAYIAPKIVGGTNAKTPVGGAGIMDLDDSFRFKMKEITNLGEDILIEYEVINCVHRNC